MLSTLQEIAKKRKMLGLTQKHLSRLAGVSQSLLAKLESGKIDPAYSKVKAILEVLSRLETRTEVHAQRILTQNVIGIQRNDTISNAVRLMNDYGFSQLPVFDGERVVGSISEKTILSQVLAGRKLSEISTSLVEEIMEEEFPQVGDDAPLSLISNLLKVYSAVLVSKKGRVVGIITKADLLKMLS